MMFLYEFAALVLGSAVVVKFFDWIYNQITARLLKVWNWA